MRASLTNNAHIHLEKFHLEAFDVAVHLSPRSPLQTSLHGASVVPVVPTAHQGDVPTPRWTMDVCKGAGAKSRVERFFSFN